MNEKLVEDINTVPFHEITEVTQETLETATENALNTKMPTGTVVEEQAASPEDHAAAFFRLQQPTFAKLLSEMAPYQLRRAILNAVTYPFNGTEYAPESEEEKQFAYLVHELMLNRTIMQLAFEMQKAEEGLQKQTENATINTNTNVKEEK